MTEPLFCSYGTIGFSAMVYDNDRHDCTVEWDGDLNKLTIDGENWRDYINLNYLENFGITKNDGPVWDYEPRSVELECYTDSGEDMIIHLDNPTKKCLQEYIDDFDINEEVLKWWERGKEFAEARGVPFDNIKEHYEEYENHLKWLQKVCDKMPY